MGDAGSEAQQDERTSKAGSWYRFRREPDLTRQSWGAPLLWRRSPMGRALLLWVIGIPIPIILLIWLLGGFH
jgi:hypothetical protein